MPTRRQPIGILLVEDNLADARLMTETLRDVAIPESVIIRVVRTLADALTEMRRYSFTCVLLDLNLPDGQGVGNVEALRAIDRRVAIVVLTGMDDERIAADAIRLGAQGAVDDVERALATHRRVKWLMLNSPSNPTGTVYSEAEYRNLAAVLERHPDGITARLHLAYAGVRHAFTTRNAGARTAAAE